MELITVEGSININGVESKFRIDNDINDSWYQWGATQDRLWDSVYIVKALERGLMEDVAFLQRGGIMTTITLTYEETYDCEYCTWYWDNTYKIQLKTPCEDHWEE